MRYFRTRKRSQRLLLVCAAIFVVVLAGTAVVASGAYPTSGVTVYTGCLTHLGNLNNVAASASTPLHPCGTNHLLHFSGGTITSVKASTGLTGGGSDGSVSLSLSTTYRLPQKCASGQVAKTSSSSSSTWFCADDQNTTYNGGDFALSGQSCPAGQFATGIGASGNLNCAQPTLDDLQGSLCTVLGSPSILEASTDPITGAVSLMCGRTDSLVLASSAGDTNIKVVSTSHMVAGEQLVLDPGSANQEIRTIASVGTGSTATTLAAASCASCTNIKVASVAGLAAGEQITLDVGANKETATISSVGTAGAGGTGVTLTAALSSAHANGAQVLQVGTGVTLTSPLTNAHSAGTEVLFP